MSLPKNNSNQIINERFEKLIRDGKNNLEKMKIVREMFVENNYNLLNKT